MRLKQKNNPKDHIKAILGEGTSFWGSLKYSGTVRIDGFFEGDIITDDILIIGSNGVVKGSIKAGFIHVFGSVIGDIRANNAVKVMSSAQIIGDIFTPMLTVEEGVKLLGSCSVGHDIAVDQKSKLLPQKDLT